VRHQEGPQDATRSGRAATDATAVCSRGLSFCTGPPALSFLSYSGWLGLLYIEDRALIRCHVTQGNRVTPQIATACCLARQRCDLVAPCQTGAKSTVKARHNGTADNAALSKRWPPDMRPKDGCSATAAALAGRKRLRLTDCFARGCNHAGSLAQRCCNGVRPYQTSERPLYLVPGQLPPWIETCHDTRTVTSRAQA
jgi:hypothetical protein